MGGDVEAKRGQQAREQPRRQTAAMSYGSAVTDENIATSKREPAASP